jgi:hypothetical protein
MLLRGVTGVIEREELAWAAGFFDGEGCISYTQSGKYDMIRIGQCERLPLVRFQTAVGGMGRIYGPYSSRHEGRWSRRPQFAYQVTGHERLQAIIAMLWFKLGPTKRTKAREVLYRVTHCHKGHPKVRGPKGCGQCTAEYWRTRREAFRDQSLFTAT